MHGKLRHASDGDGVYHIQMGGYIFNISQEAQLKIKRQKAPKTVAEAASSKDSA